MEICHFFVILYDFVMRCVYKSTIYKSTIYKSTIYTLLYKSVHVTFVFWVPKTPPTPRHFCVRPPPQSKIAAILHHSCVAAHREDTESPVC